MKKIFVILTGMCLLLHLPGCAATGKVHDKSYLRAVSISGENEKELTFTFFSEEDSLVSGSGKDIASAQRNAELECGKPIFTGYTELVIINGVESRDILEFLLNEWRVSPSCIVVRSDDGEELLRSSSAETLVGSVKRAAEQGIAPESDIITVIADLLSEEKSAEVPEISKDGVIGARSIY